MEKITVFWEHNPIRAFFSFCGNHITLFWKSVSSSASNEISLEISIVTRQKALDNSFKNWKIPKLSTAYCLMSNKTGFTLVELVTAIGVLAILATVAFTALNPLEQFKKVQDSKRKSDLSQIQKALEGYYQDYHRYPPSSGNKIAPGNVAINWGQAWQPYIDVLPIDPKAAKNYAYWVDESSVGQSYRLYASFDKINDPDLCVTGGGACPNLPAGTTCGGICNYGVSSPNVSP